MPATAPISTIVFDLGGVLVDWNPRYLFTRLFDDHAEMEYFLREVCSPSWNEQQDAGRSWADATALLIEQHPEYAQQIIAYWKRWPEMLRGAIDGSVQLLEQLRQNNSHRLLALTNWSAETFAHARQRFDFLRYFEGILVSGAEKLKKPDPRIYQLLFKRYSLNATECLFIDDSLPNVKAAKALGMEAIYFRSPERLRAALQQRKVLSA